MYFEDRLGSSAMTAASVAAYLGRILETNDVRELCAIAAEIRRAHEGDAEAETVARHAELKRRRLLATK